MKVSVQVLKKDITTNTYSLIGNGQGHWQEQTLTCEIDDSSFMRLTITKEGITCYRSSEIELTYDCIVGKKTTMAIKNELGDLDLEILTHDLVVSKNEIMIDYEVLSSDDNNERLLISWHWQELA